MRPRKRDYLVWKLAGAVLAASASGASAASTGVDIRSTALNDALAELARETGIEILYETNLVRNKRATAVKGKLSADQALSALLKGSGLGYRVSPDGLFVLFELPRQVITDPGDGAVSEVLVIGRRTQNADIRRTENDIQPYFIAGPRELDVAPQDSIDQYLRDRLPANGQSISPSQYVTAGAATNSAIDLRGVGTQRTLVLLDGRRLPSLPTDAAGLDQADLNAIPLGAVERIETLTATAGGIHGPTAIGGVVNVVLKRDYRGADLTVVSGITSRGDAARGRLEARIGFTPNQGRTDVMLSASYAGADPLTVGQRDYAERSLRRQAANNPRDYLIRAGAVDAITVRSGGGEALRLDAALGGATLTSSYTFLPLGFIGGPQETAAALVANSGRFVTRPPGDVRDKVNLVSTPQSRSVLVNVRHTLSDRFEVFVDGVHLDNQGRSLRRQTVTWRAQTHANAAGNLFANTVYFDFPVADHFKETSVRIEARRLTAGVIASLPGRWKASADYTVGRSLLESREEGLAIGQNISAALWNGYVGPGGEKPVIPLGDYSALQAALRDHTTATMTQKRMVNDFSDGALRVAGPLMTLPGGPLTLTLQAQHRRERMPEGPRVTLAQGRVSSSLSADRSQVVRSGYMELRAPLAPATWGFAPARGLELQVALRRDDVRSSFPSNVFSQTFYALGRTSVRHRADVFTLGARAFPAPWLMARASMATGETPPNLSQLQERGVPVTVASLGTVDPKRGGRPVSDDGLYYWVREGWRGLGQEKGRTMSAGVVFNPSGRAGPRVSVDFSRVDIRDEIGPFDGSGGLQGLIDNEERYPGRVAREPLSAADAALGYTAGRITALHVGRGNSGRTIAETVDFQLDWPLGTVSGGQARLYGAATWQPTLRTKLGANRDWFERAGYRDAPLEWRGDAGLQWIRGPLTIDLNGQYLGRYKILWSPADVASASQFAALNQGSANVPSQVYVDLVARRRFEFAADSRLRALEVRFAVQNLLDQSPPIVADHAHMGYDYHGDPRRRRFELLMAAKF